MLNCKTFFILLGIVAFSLAVSAQENKELDYLIKGALVFDGTQQQPVKRDVGIKGKMIVYLQNANSPAPKSKKVIDANGLYLTPGFIDPHTHYGKWLDNKSPEERGNLPCLQQGVTTVFIGSDGFGSYNIKKQARKYMTDGIGTNAAFFVGFGAVRKAVLGSENRSPDEGQLKRMEELVARGMKEGAFGLSTGLYYTPQAYSTTEEVIALARVATRFNGIYDTHMRSESNGLEKAVQETIDIGAATGIPLMISHIKCLGPAAWGTSDAIISMIENAQKKGISIVASQYPYNASHTSLKAMLVPSWAQAGGNARMVERLKNEDTLRRVMDGLSRNLSIRGGDSKIVLSSAKNPKYHTRTLHQIATELKMSPEDAAVHILCDVPGISAVSFSMIEEDVVNFMKQPWVTTGSDGGGGHPRTYGTFIKKLKHYVMDEHVLSMADAIHRSTGLTAEFLGISGRGFIREGYYADIVIFDPETLEDNATFTNPPAKPGGVKYVLVNGTMAMKDGRYSGVLAGEVLIHEKTPK